jgi:hypothetical protein
MYGCTDREFLLCFYSMAKPKRISDREYEQRKALLTQGQASQAEQADKAILTLASGAFAVSLAFIRDIAGPGTPAGLPLLIWGWGALLASVTFVLFSLRMGAEAHAFEDCELEEHKADPTYVLRTNHWAKGICVLNWVALALLIFGASLLAAFAIANLENGKV